MRADHVELWRAIESFQIGPPDCDLPFGARLARENGWSLPFAARVIAEYKRFVFLAATAPHPVTPSDSVDQAWHLHLLYSESYWSELCGQVLRRPLHHGPTRGGVAEGHKFRDWYAATLDRYEQEFAATPPRDIWPGVRARFAGADRFERVNRARHLVLRKPGAGIASLAVGIVAAIGCSSLTSRSGGAIAGAAFLLTMIVVLGIALRRSGSGRRTGGGCGGGWTGGGGCGGGHGGHGGGGHGHGSCGGGHGDGGSGCGSSGCGGGSGCSGGGCGGGGH